MNTFNLTLDLNKSRASSPVRLRQGDAQGTTITALVLDHGATANLTGMTAQLVMELPDGTQYYRKTASISGNSVSVLVDETQAASVSGRSANAYFQMLQGTTVKASTGSFAVEILPDALEGHTVSESYDSAIQEAIDALDEAVEQLPSTVEDVLADHPEWTTTVTDGSITAPKLASSLTRAVLIGQGSVTASTYSTLLPDADGAARGTLWCVTGGYDSILHLPVARPGFLLTYGTGKLSSTASQAVQLYYTIGSTGTTQATDTRLYFRTRWGASDSPWGEWERAATMDDVRSASAPYADVSMFRKVGVLGDSFAIGSMYVGGEFVTSDYEQSWPMNLSRQHGVEVVRYSNGGWGAYNWLNTTGSYGLDKFEADIANDNVCGLYVIAFGINDSNPNMTFGGVSGGSAYLGSSADIDTSDYTQNANTFWGQMGRIISTIRAEAPNSRIVLTTLARENNAARRSFTDAVKEIGTYYGVPVLYLYGDAFFTSDYWVSGFDGNHPTAPMYSGMAVAINRLLAQSMADNYSYFSAYTGV